jgi:hypothetical protein
MAEEKKEVVRTIYHIIIGSNEYLATYDKAKALELWNLLSDNFFRIAREGNSYTSRYDMERANKDHSMFMYEGEISESGTVLGSINMYLYPDAVSARKAKNAFEKMKEVKPTGETESSPF